MEEVITSTIVGVRFHPTGKIYHFDIAPYPGLKPGDFVIVETSRGRQLGEIAGFVPPDQAARGVKPIKSPATPRDLILKKLWEAKEADALATCCTIASSLGGFEGVKFVQASYNYDGSTLVFLYTTEEDVVNTARLRRRLEQKFHTRVDMRRIGSRDAAKLLGEYGACGEPRCCAVHLTDFDPISIRMAKAQGISLNPSEITGMCGRLRCCLAYEYELYVEASKGLPRINRQVSTPYGEGYVIDVNPLNQTVTVQVDDSRYEVHRDDLQPPEEKTTAAPGCPRESCARCGFEARGQTKSPDETSPDTEQKARPARKGRSRKRRSSRRHPERRSGRSRRLKSDRG